MAVSLSWLEACAREKRDNDAGINVGQMVARRWRLCLMVTASDGDDYYVVVSA
jgi:hypothetical protein